MGGFSHPDVAGTLKYLPAALVVSAQSALVPIDHFIPQLLNFELYTPLSIVGLLQRIMLMILIGKAHIMSIGDLHGYKTLKSQKRFFSVIKMSLLQNVLVLPSDPRIHLTFPL